MDKIELNKCQKDNIAEICAEFGNAPGELINVLHKCQGGSLRLSAGGGAARDCPQSAHSRGQGLWSRYILLFLHHAAQGPPLHLGMYGYGLLCAWSRGRTGRAQERAQDRRWRSHPRREVLPGVPALRGRLRSGTRDAGGVYGRLEPKQIKGILAQYE